MARKILTFVLCVLLINKCMSSRILGVFPVPCMSHQQVYHRLMEELAIRGHEIVVLTPDGAIYNKLSNITVIDANNVSYNTFQSKYNFVASQEQNTRQLLNTLTRTTTYLVDAQLSLPQMQEILTNQNEQFDLIFAEILMPYLMQLSARFKAPLIGICSFSAGVTSFDTIGNPSQPLFYPDNFVRYIGVQNLWQRLDTVYSYIYHKYLDVYKDEDRERLMQNHFGVGTPTASNAGDLMSMLLLNMYPVFSGIRPTVPDLVYLGGLHLSPNKELPKDLQFFLDSSPQGVIYLSFGSSLKTFDLPWSKIEIVLNVFHQLPYNYVLKWDNDTMALKSSNVYISKWLPQQDMLGHHNIKAFISQCGQQSVEESIHSRVPLLCIPFLGDQFMNLQLVVKHGIGQGLDINMLDEKSLKQALVNVAENKRYIANLENLSAVLQDQKWTSLERAVWWTEFVLRHKGVTHMRGPTVSLYEYLMIDVAAFILAVLFLVCFLVYLILKFFKTLPTDCLSKHKK